MFCNPIAAQEGLLTHYMVHVHVCPPLSATYQDVVHTYAWDPDTWVGENVHITLEMRSARSEKHAVLPTSCRKIKYSEKKKTNTMKSFYKKDMSSPDNEVFYKV